VAEFRVPFDSPRLIESKSLKLYLNSFSMSRFASAHEVREQIARDLGASAGTLIEVRLFTSRQALPLGTAAYAAALFYGGDRTFRALFRLVRAFTAPGPTLDTDPESGSPLPPKD